MPPPVATNDLAFELVARWEDEQLRGGVVSLEEVCAGHPELLPAVREIARGIAVVAPLFAPVPAGAGGPAGPPAGKDLQLPAGWQEVDRGASSIVYRGPDPTFGTVVAFKVLHPRGPILLPADVDRLMKRFEQEARILARLKHEGIVRIFKTFGLNGRPVLEMEYLPGGSLVTHLKAVRARGAAGIAPFLERVARAVGFAHDHGIVHRDLKPSNILLDAAGRPCVSDFGVAKFLHLSEPAEPTGGPGDDTDPGKDLTKDGRQPGTRAYMAPEQFDPSFGPIRPTTDVWALGVILYELLNGTRPFAGGTAFECKTAVCEGPPPPCRWSRWRREGQLERIALRCLTRAPARRYASAAALAAALAAVTRPRWRKPAFAGGVLALALAAAAVGAAVDSRAQPPPQEEGSDEALRALTAEVARTRPEQAVPLLDQTGRPKWFRWVMGRATGKVVPTDDGALTLVSPVRGLIELLPDPQSDRYCFRAKVRHSRSEPGGEVGLYVGRDVHAGGPGDTHVFTRLTFNDVRRPPVPPIDVHVNKGGKAVVLRRNPPDPAPLLVLHLVSEGRAPGIDSPVDIQGGLPFRPNGEDGGCWRELKVVVTPQDVVTWWDGQPPLSASADALTKAADPTLDFLRQAPAYKESPFVQAFRPRHAPRGGLGLYLSRGLASFSAIAITPLPPGG